MDYASTALSVAMKIKEIVEKNSKNKKNLFRESVRLVDDIQNLEELRKGRISDSLPMLDKDIAALQSNLHELLYDCDKIYKTKSGFGGYVKRMKARVFSADDIAQQIGEIRKEVDRAYTKFLAANGVSNSISIAALGVERDGAALQESLDARVSAAQGDLAQAGALFGINVMSISEKKKALRKATIELGDVDEEKEVEHRILSIKVKALRATLEINNEMFRAERATAPDGYEFSGSGTFHPTFKDPVADRASAVQEAYSLLGALKKKDSGVSAITWLHRATRLSCILGLSLGLKSDALLLSQMCYSIARQLSEQNPAFFSSELAVALHNVSVDLSAMGEHQKALDAIQEAVQLRRKLAERSPDVFEPDLASSLDNLSSHLSDTGEHQKAIDTIQEAVQLYRKLAERKPEVFENDLARSLNNLSNRLSDTGEHLKAIDASQEAVQLYRRLDERSPEVSEQDLPVSLSNLSNHLSAIGEYQKAIDAVQEAVQLYRKLAERSPEVFEKDLARSLNNISNHLSSIGEHHKAIDVIQESVKLYRKLTERSPEVFDYDLASSLNNLSLHLSNILEHQKAIEAIQEAVQLYRKLTLRSPKTYEPGLGNALETFGNILIQAGSKDEAVVHLKESVNILGRYMSVCPGIVKKPYEHAILSLKELGVE